jgi:hypothetical protein
MKKTELVLNMMRIALTQETNITGQDNLERIHRDIGREIRNTYRRISMQNPEDIRMEQDLSVLKKKLKRFT